MIFVDTGAFVARSAARDQYHDRAVEFWAGLEKANDRLLTHSTARKPHPSGWGKRRSGSP